MIRVDVKDLKGDEIKDFWHGLVPYLGLSGFFAALILAEHNMSIATIIMIVTFIITIAMVYNKYN